MQLGLRLGQRLDIIIACVCQQFPGIRGKVSSKAQWSSRWNARAWHVHVYQVGRNTCEDKAVVTVGSLEASGVVPISRAQDYL